MCIRDSSLSLPRSEPELPDLPVCLSCSTCIPCLKIVSAARSMLVLPSEVLAMRLGGARPRHCGR
eukprot:2343043-Alexandrium_andersonii.AAC.1